MNRVLVVDDEKPVLDLMTSLCEKNGFCPLVASSAKEAIEVFRREKPGIVVTDLVLGGDMDGIALCSWVRSHNHTAVLIAVSAYFSEFDKEYCMAAGFSDFIVKPFRIADFADALACASSRRRRWMELPPREWDDETGIGTD